MALGAAAVVSWGCGDDAPEEERDAGTCAAGGAAAGGGDGEVCGAGEVVPVNCAAGESALEDGRCLPAGMQENGCAAGEVKVESGGCRPAGIPPEACGQGFEPDGEGGCRVILPRDPCPRGTMAVPGETACREVAPCGEGPWGDIPVEPDTEYVDGSYQGSRSDGSRERPWTTITAALRNAAPGAIVAIASGTYEENVYVRGGAARLWGRCPALVEIAGSASASAAVNVQDEAHGTEIRGVAVRGSAIGVGVWGPADVVLDRVWIHDTEQGGINIGDGRGPSAVAVRSSLVEDTRNIGVWVGGAKALIEQTVVRNVADVGIVAVDNPDTGRRAEVDVRSSVVQGAHDIGVLVEGSDLDLFASVVRDTIPNEEPNSGRGINIQGSMSHPGRQSVVMIRSSLIYDNHDIGISVINSELLVDATVVRGTLLAPIVEDTFHGYPTLSGVGIAILDDEASAEPTKGTIRSSVVEDNRQTGVFVMGAAVAVEGTIVRRTQPVDESESGEGIGVREGLPPARRRGDVGVSSSVIEWNHSAGLQAMGSTIRLDATVVRDTQPLVGSLFGVGVVVQAAPGTTERGDLTMRSSIIERNPYAGLLIAGSSALVERTLVRDTRPAPAGDLGRGIVVQSNRSTGQQANAIIRDCVVERNHELGIAVAGSAATIENTAVRDTKPRSDLTRGDGISVLYDSVRGLRGDAVIRRSTVERNTHVGISVIGSDAVIERSSVRETRKEPAGDDYGDGIAVVSELNRASATISDCLVEANEGVGVSSFGADVLVSSTQIVCNYVDLDAVAYGEHSYNFPLSDSMACRGCTGEPRKCEKGNLERQPPRAVDPAPTPP
ncbi:right-handed parallel beta-helix repeat-containing protein [Sorangium sp. So ce131]|uniref:right-handed parallel beta-helix repeat-containing protein n=1 Tax=Sorangium sp. So ce131 TaxID=3133282 RepID=UPI003F5F8A4B